MIVKKIFFGTTEDANVGILILRVFLGAALMTHGCPKMFGGLSGFTENVASMGMPFPQVLAFLAAFAESIGALLLAIGLLARPMAVMIVCTMAVAVFEVHGGQPFAKQEMAWLYLIPALMFVLKGAGKWSLDFLISRK